MGKSLSFTNRAKKYFTVFLVFLMLTSIIPPINTEAISVVNGDGLSISSTTKYQIPSFSTLDYYYRENWDVLVNGSNQGQMALFAPAGINSNEGRTFADYSTLYAWGSAFGGNPDYVKNQTLSTTIKKVSTGTLHQRYYSVDIGRYAGAKVVARSGSGGQGYLEVTKSSFPNITKLQAPTEVTQNTDFNVIFSGVEYDPFSSSMSYKISVNGSQKASGSFTASQLGASGSPETNGTFIDKTEAIRISTTGTYTIKLELTDQIQRTSTKTITLTVKAAPPTGQPYLEITPDLQQIQVGEIASYQAYYYDANGNKTDVTTNTGTTWTSFSSATASLQSKGKFKGLTEGNLSVRAQYNGLQDLAQLVVSNQPPPPPPDPVIPRDVSAAITGPGEVMVGEKFCLQGSGSSLPDGTIVNYNWSFSGAGSISGAAGCDLWYPATGLQTVTLTVTDDKGNSASTEHFINVIPPQPTAYFSWTGTNKENRKMTLQASHPYGNRNGVISSYPMVEEKWTITAVDPANQSYIKTVQDISGNVSYSQVVDILMKVKGDYKVKRYVKNIIGLEDTMETIITVEPDRKPVANFTTVTTIYRDDVREQPDHSKATIKITDSSYSRDDSIAQRIWTYRYDSNNDGQFTENAIVISNTNEEYVEITGVEKVGKYLIELQVIEQFDQPTLDAFVVPGDRRRHQTDQTQDEEGLIAKPIGERIVNLDNLAPSVSYDVQKRKTVELTLNVGQTNKGTKEVIQTKVDSLLKERLNQAGYNLNVTTQQINISGGLVIASVTKGSDLPSPVIMGSFRGYQEQNMVTVNGKPYLHITTPSNTYNQESVYFDIDANAGSFTSSLPVSLFNPSSSIVGTNKVLLTGGLKNGDVTNDVYLFDPATNTWTQKRSLPYSYGVSSHGQTSLPNGDVMITGGYRSNGGTTYFDSFLYSFSTNDWILLSPLPQVTSRSGQDVELIQVGTDTVLAFGPNIPGKILRYSISKNSWDQIVIPADLSLVLKGATIDSNTVFLIGSSLDGNQRISYYFDTTSMRWVKTSHVNPLISMESELTKVSENKLVLLGSFGNYPYYYNVSPLESYSIPTYKDESVSFTAIFEDSIPSKEGKQLILNSHSINSSNLFISGTNTNEAEFKSLLSELSKGEFINDANLDNAVTKLGDYILFQLGNKQVEVQIDITDSPVSKDILNAKFNTIVKPLLNENKIGMNLKLFQQQKTANETIAAGGGFNGWSLAVKPDGTVWKSRSAGFEQVAGLTNVVSVSMSPSHNLVLKDDGTIWSWGSNYNGQLGLGFTSSEELVIQPVKNLTDVIAISAGTDYSLALKKDGTVWGWGTGLYAKNGSPTTSNSTVPFQIAGLSNIKYIKADVDTSMAIDKSGTAWGWGKNIYGGINYKVHGDGTYYHDIPYKIDWINNLSTLGVGNGFVIASKNDGTVWGWGTNGSGSLGLGHTNSVPGPAQLTSLTDIVKVEVGAIASYALKKDGTLWSWGSNPNGETGTGTWGTEYSPKQISLTNIASVAAGGNYALALSKDGSIFGWGNNNNGQIGLSTPTQSLTPILVPNHTFKAESISQSGMTEFEPTSQPLFTGIVSDKVVDNTQLSKRITNMKSTFVGFGNSANKSQIEQVISGNGGKGKYFDVVNIDSSLQQLAQYIVEQMQLDTIDLQIAVDETSYTPTQIQTEINSILIPKLNSEGIITNLSVKKVEKTSPGQTIAVGSNHSLFLMDTSDVYAVGNNYKGPLGDGTTTSTSTPVKMKNPWGTTKVSGVYAGYFYSLILLENGDVYGTGDNFNGQIGIGNSLSPTQPTKMLKPWGTTKVVDIAAGEMHSVVVLEDGQAYSMGYNGYGNFGNNTTDSSYTPVKMQTPWGNTKVVSAAAGLRHTLVLLENGEIYGAGLNNYGQLGTGNSNSPTIPTKMLNPWGTTRVKQIVTSQYHTLILLEDGKVYSTGNNAEYQLGDGTNYSRTTPVKMQTPWGATLKAIDVSVTMNESYILLENGEVWKTNISNGITKVPAPWGTIKVKSIQSGQNHTLFLLENGEVYGIGVNQHSQLADGTYSTATSPVKSTSIISIGKVLIPTSNFKTLLWESSSNRLFGGYINQNSVNINEVTKQALISDATFVGLGNDFNKLQMETVVQKNMLRGTFIQDTPLNTAVNQMADYIIAEVKKKRGIKELYVTLDEQVNYFTTYHDYENDPKLADRWKYEHIPTVFENDMGQDSRQMMELSTPIPQFSKVGRYQPYYSARDNPIFWGSTFFSEYQKWAKDADNWYIYAHRKPVPEFTFTINGTTGAYTITNTAYDLDKQSISIGFGPGLRSQNWKWRLQGESIWKDGLPASPLERKIYEVKNTVMDFQNREEYLVKTLDATGVNKAPIADFEPIPNAVFRGDNVTYRNYSYDPNGDPLTYEWSWKKEADATWTNGTPTNSTDVTKEPVTRFNQPGKFIVRLRVKDSMNSYSGYVEKSVEVFNRPPTVLLEYTPTTNIKNDTTVSFNANSNDPDSADVSLLTYKWEFKEPGAAAFTTYTSTSKTFNRTLPIVGDWEVRVTVTDPYGATAQDTKVVKVVSANNPPVAGFNTDKPSYFIGDLINVTSTATDPDGDVLTYSYEITSPFGVKTTQTTANFALPTMDVGTYTIKQTVSDGKGGTATITKSIIVNDLEIRANIYHTPEWKIIHDSKGHHFLDFYSGEKFVLAADVTDAPIEYVRVTAIGESIDGSSINDTITLTKTTNILYEGVYFKDSFADPLTLIKKSPPPMLFKYEVKYANGTIRNDEMYVNIIGSVYDVMNFHQRF